MSDQGSSTFKQDLEALRNRKSDAAAVSRIETAGHIGAGSIIIGHAAKIACQARKAGAPIKPALRCFARRVFVPLAAAMAGSAVADAIGADDMLVDRLGKPRQAAKGRQPAHVGHRIAHNKSSRGFFTGLLAAVVAGAAVAGILALTIGTGGLLGPVLIGFAAGFAYSAVAGMEKKTADICGHIETGSQNVFFEGNPVARVNDLAICDRHSPPQRIMEGSKTIFVNNYPLARIGHQITCSAVVQEGCSTIFADTTNQMYGEPDSEISVGEQLLQSGIEVLGATSAVREGGLLGRLLRRLFGEPVDAATGDYASYHTDFSYPCVPALQLTRAYAGKERVHGLMGAKWICNWSQRLLFDTETPTVLLEDAEGQRLRFVVGKSPEFATRHLKAPYYHLAGVKEHARLFDSRTQTTLIFTTSGADPHTGILSAIQDRNGNRIEFIYTIGRLSRVLCPDGTAFSVRTNEQGAIETVTREGETSPVVCYEYDSSVAMTDAISRFNGELHYRYNHHGWLTHWHDSGATNIDIEYDGEGRVTATRSPEGLFNDRFVYHPDERKTEYIDATGARTTIWFNEKNLPIREQDPLGNITLNEWDGLERKLSTTDALERVTRYDYDQFGRLLGETDWANRKTKYDYDANGQITRMQFPDGREALRGYDDRGNPASATEPDGTTFLFSYDERGRLLTETGPDGAVSQWEYDGKGRLVAAIDALGNRTGIEEDFWGRPRSITNPAGHMTRFECVPSPENPRRDVSRIIHPDGGEERFTYDREGLLATNIAPEGQKTCYSHGAFDLLRSITDAKGYTTKLDYDGAARLKSVTNAQGRKWTYSYDPVGRLASESDWAGRQTRYIRDTVGRVITKRLPDGIEQHIAWDDRDRITSVQTSRSRIDYEYDNADRLTRATTCDLMFGNVAEPETEILLIYDEHGRLAREVQNGIAIEYRYDDAGRCINRTSPSGQTALFFDPRGLLAEYQSNGHGLSFQRNALGLETERRTSSGNPFALLQGYDSCGRLKSQYVGRRRETPLSGRLPGHLSPALELAEQVSRRYRWDKSGRAIAVQDSVRGLKSFSYDPRDQVTDVRRPVDLKGKESGEGYDYDALMNLARSHGNSHEYRNGVVTKVGRTRYTYDMRGRTRTRTELRNGFRPRTWNFFWDDFDRLTDVHKPDGAIWRYTCDAFGRRAKKECVQPAKTGRKSRVTYLWQGATLAEEWKTIADAPETVLVSRWHFEPGTFNPLAKETLTIDVGAEKAGEAKFCPIVTDHLGPPKELFDENGECLWQADHSLWGKADIRFAKSDNCRPVADCSLRFQNQWEDEESGLYYNLHRYYDPDSGQYLSQDPIGLEGGLRTHGYVHDPMHWVDPLGLCKKPIIMGENMRRVKAYADKVGGQTINDFIPSNKWTLKKNEAWFRQMKAEGREIIDIGPDFNRRLRERAGGNFNPAREAYNLERKESVGYPIYRKIYKRSGKFEGGVPGFD